MCWVIALWGQITFILDDSLLRDTLSYCESFREGLMANLTPPTKTIFNISVLLGVIALIMYFVNVFGVATISMNLAFWVAAAAWGVLMAGVCMKGV